jgi:exosortase
MLNYHLLVKLIAVFGAITLIYFETVSGLFTLWLVADQAQSHGLIVVVMALFVIYKRLGLQPTTKPAHYIVGALLLVLGSMVWYLAATINIEIINQLILLPIIFLFIWALFGWRPAYSLLGPICFLVFAVPVWDYLTPLLVGLSSDVVTWLVGHTRIPAYINGSTINLPSGSLVIADGCSGLRYLIISLALVGYIIMSSITTLKDKLFVLLLAIVLGLFVNWLRIFIIVLIAHATDMQSSLVEEHEMFGWFLFALVCLPLIFMSRRLEPVLEGVVDKGASVNTVSVILAVLALSIGPTFYYLSANNRVVPVVSEWSVQGFQRYTASNGILRQPSAKLVLEKELVVNGKQLKGFVVLNWQQHNNENLVPYWPKPYNERLWQYNKTDVFDLGEAGVSVISLERLPFGKNACMAIQYQVGGQVTPSYTMAKLLQIPASLLSQNYFIAYGVLVNVEQGGCAVEKERLLNAVSALQGEIQELLIF